MARDSRPRRLRLSPACCFRRRRLPKVASSPESPAVPAPEVTFTKDIAPILQRRCQRCHHADGGAPMALTTFDEVRPYAKSMKTRTAMGRQRGVMPPWFVEKNIGIQNFKNDPSLSDDEVATIAKWADSGAPRGNPADMPAPRAFDDDGLGDRRARSRHPVGPEVVTVPAIAPTSGANRSASCRPG